MPEKRRQYEQEFKEGAVRIVRESGKSIAEIARDLDINAGTLGNWVARETVRHRLEEVTGDGTRFAMSMGSGGLRSLCIIRGVNLCVEPQ